jgi:hypothetical protein
VTVAWRVDRVCDQLETAWKATVSADQQKRIDDYLVRLLELERTALLRELIVLEIARRRLQGQ